jgi:hypothetical protein
MPWEQESSLGGHGWTNLTPSIPLSLKGPKGRGGEVVAGADQGDEWFLEVNARISCSLSL